VGSFDQCGAQIGAVPTEQFTEACEWIGRDMGFKYKSTRLGEYEKQLKYFVNSGASIPEDDKEMMDRYYVFMQSSTETQTNQYTGRL